MVIDSYISSQDCIGIIKESILIMNYPVVIIRITYGTGTYIKLDQVGWHSDKEESDHEIEQ